jgi:hypothetical protein
LVTAISKVTASPACAGSPLVSVLVTSMRQMSWEMSSNIWLISFGPPEKNCAGEEAMDWRRSESCELPRSYPITYTMVPALLACVAQYWA